MDVGMHAKVLTREQAIAYMRDKYRLPVVVMGHSNGGYSVAEILKPLGYATGQFGKNHLGDRNEHLPTNHGFDEFFGNLYHLNAEEEPESANYPPADDFPNFRARFGPWFAENTEGRGSMDLTLTAFAHDRNALYRNLTGREFEEATATARRPSSFTIFCSPVSGSAPVT